MKYSEMSRDQLCKEREAVLHKYNELKAKNISLDLSRGKPNAEQLDVSRALLSVDLDGKNSYDKEDYCTGTAILIGNEGNGLRDEVSNKADIWVRIPMEGQVESLNAAIAASVLMFEVARQRRQ